jgi:tRNA threonylcarbamoyladenosine biosynthesis protein TsaE
MFEVSLELPTEAATARLGAALGRLLRPGDVVGLSGPLGAGKTTLARAIIRAIGGPDTAPSPTFALVEPYETLRGTLRHFDLYRLEKDQDVWELDFEDAQDGIALIEWPERIERLLPASTLLVRLSVEGPARRVLMRGDEEWRNRLQSLNASSKTHR